MALNLAKLIIEFLKGNPDQKFTARQIAEWVSRGGVKEPGMGGVMAPAEPGVKRGFERFQGCGFLPFLATAF
ncbi:hypothetical protein KDX13_36480, partial [Burkholderia cenocepacia]|uniref:hypothetical protein n=1 Tax=Burkholderia cenocepacia TaxID=95486 RepID=UPI001B93FC16